jgi:hypothetical protein
VVSSEVLDPAETVLIKVLVVRPVEATAVCRAVSKPVVGLGEVGAVMETGPTISHVVTCPRRGNIFFHLPTLLYNIISKGLISF